MGRQSCAARCCWGFIGIVLGHAAALAVEPLRLQPAPLAIKPGDPMCERAMVTHPPAVRGVLSWTIESRNHRGRVNTLSISPDGQQIVTSGMDGTVRIWNLKTGELVRVMVGHNHYVTNLAWSPCGNVIASAGCYDGSARLWNAKTGQPLRVFKKLRSPVKQVAWTADGTQLLIGCGDSGGQLYRWTAATDQVAEFMEVRGSMGAVSWSPDGKRLAMCVSEQPANVFDVASMKAIFTCGLATDWDTHAAWSPDSRVLATGRSEQTSVWTLDKPGPPLMLPGSNSAAFSPDGKQLALATGGSITIHDLSNAKAVNIRNFPAHQVVWQAQSGLLVAVSGSGYAVWQATGGKLTEVFRKDASGFAPAVWTSGQPVVTGIGTTKLNIWDPVTATLQRTLPEHSAAVASIAWSRDGHTLAAAMADAAIRISAAKSGETIATLKGHKNGVTSIAWSPDGRTLASGSQDKTVRLWDAAGNLKGTLEGHNAAVLTVAWAPSGNLLASGSSDESAILWNPLTKEKVRVLRAARPVNSVSMTTLNKVLVVALGTADNIAIYNGNTGTLYPTFRQPGWHYCRAVCWMPSGPNLISGRDHTTQLWDVTSNRVVLSLETTSQVCYVANAADGAVLLAGSDDRTVRFWDGAKGQLRGVILSEPGYIVYLTADGLWRADPDKKFDLVYVAQTDQGQLTLSGDEFASRFLWKNVPTKVKMVTR